MQPYLRKVKKDDCNLLFRWANDEAVRSNSFNQEKILYEHHVKWFNEILKNKNTLIYIMTKDNISIGQVRITINECEGTIGYSIEKNYRGKKLGVLIIKLVEKQLQKFPNITTLVAYVKNDNEPSQRVFKKLKYKEKILRDRRVYFKTINNK